MKKITAKFVLERDTKNTIRYEEIRTAFIGKLYIAKATFGASEPPKHIVVTIGEESEEKAAA